MLNVNENYNGKEITTTADKTTNERCNMLPQVHIERLNFPSTTFKTSPNKIENSSFESDDYRDKIVDVSKLMAQIFNAKVVLEKLEEPLIKSSVRFPLTCAVSLHANVDLDGENDEAREANGKICTRYCAKCEKTVIARLQDPTTKNCSDCKTVMTFLCTKCNVKHYGLYAFFISHWDRCNGDETSIGQIDEDDQSELNDKDTSTADEQNDDVDQIEANIEETGTIDAHSTSVLKKDQFIVKEIPNANFSEKYVRYCSKCDVVIASNVSRCSTCDRYLLFACKKCNAKYDGSSSILYHFRNKCYPTKEYQCTRCPHTTTDLNLMHRHFKNMHSDRPVLKCQFCSFETKNKYSLKKHVKVFHRGKITEQTESNIEDTTTADVRIDSKRSVDENQFIVRKLQVANIKERYTRHCSKCNMVIEKYKAQCYKCEKQSIDVVCKKCNARFISYDGIKYHLKSQCYAANEYQCRQCMYTTTNLRTMRKHCKYMHIDQPVFKCQFCPHKTKYKRSLSKHVKIRHHGKMVEQTDKVDQTEQKNEDATTADAYTDSPLHHGKMVEGSDEVDQSESNIKDTTIAGDHVHSSLVLDRNQFVVKEIYRESLSEKYTQYCFECDVQISTAGNHGRRCNTCDNKISYVCKKCNSKYSSNSSIWYHLKSQCYPTNEYRCIRCKYTANNWILMRQHFKNIHITNVPKLNCKLCSYEAKNKHELKNHLKSVHEATDMKFHCENCEYSARFQCTLRRHRELCH